ncbi:MAG: toast rack family protein [Candidatus Marinimicrobia bacterium]|nr:toast rack family protein [Candidatus Neomarinimicrobiota bacterium]MCF7829985.1 toast rack family protein [Candidatus Neomarinimicrobiota bacterium]MCF7881861.1 toast rack family protein [Candidatus Neomarinimicrobiota bacterium]
MLKKLLMGCLILSLGIHGVVNAQGHSERIQRSELLTSEKSINIDVEYALGRFTLKPSLADEAFAADIIYNPELFEPQVNYEIRDDIGYLEISSNKDNEMEFDWEDRDTESEWDINYNPTVPTSMDLSVGLGKGIMELGGARITSLSVENGLSETEIDFSKPNMAVMEYMDFETGLGKFRAKSLSNARFEKLDFECGLGSATLDFHGVGLDKSEVNISVGLGSATIIVPENIGVRVETGDNFMSSISFDSSFRKHSGYYYSPNWNEAEKKMKINIEVGLGSANIERLP